MRQSAGAILAVLAGMALALPATAAAAPPDLTVRSVAVPPRAAAAGALELTVTTANRGDRARASAAEVVLSADRRRDARDVVVTERLSVRALGARRSLRTTRVLTLPAAVAVGRFHVVVCADARRRIRERNERNNCRASSKRVEITDTPTSSRDLIEAAVANGSLSQETALQYRVLAAFGDRRLPARFRGDPAEGDHLVMREVVRAWPRLSARQRATIEPYFTPPAARGSWASRAAARAAAAGPAEGEEGADEAPGCVTAQLADRHWRSVASENGPVRVWWLASGEESHGARARSLLAEVERSIWPKLTAVLGRQPLSDASQACFHGGDGKLDIYVMPVSGAKALTVAYPPACSAAPAFIVVNPYFADRWTIAHELMHAFQFSYRYAAPCDAYSDWDEATATWAAEHVYPKDDGEHSYRWFLWYPYYSLIGESYGGWVFPYFLERVHGAGVIGSIYAETERNPPLEAVDAAVPGRLEKAWPEFARYAWNQMPVEPSYAAWDRLEDVPLAGYQQPLPVEELAPGGTVRLPVELKALTRAYKHVKVTGEPRAVIVNNTLAYWPRASVQALLKQADGQWRSEDWTNEPRVVICPESAAQRIEELVLVMSNSSLDPASVPVKPEPAPAVAASNVGCVRYRGEASGTATSSSASQSLTESWTARDLVYQRRPAHQSLDFALAGGTIEWQLRGTVGDCTISAGPIPFAVAGDAYDLGLAPLGTLEFSTQVEGAQRGYYRATGSYAKRVQASVTCPDPDDSYTRNHFPQPIWLDSGGNRLAVHFMEGDGTVVGSETASETQWQYGWSWRLAPDG